MSSTSTNTISELHENPQILKPRTVIKKVLSSGAGRGCGSYSSKKPELRNFDPFLLLDYATFSPPAGFPDHPHRGFETVTYVLESNLAHEDFAGHNGTIGPGDLKWMTAGRGILHSKMLVSKDINRVQKQGVDVRIIAGEAFGVRSPIYTRTPTMYLDFTMNPGAQLHQLIPECWNAFVYIIEGERVFGNEGSSPAWSHHSLVLSNGDGVRVWNKSEKSLRFLLIAGQPLNEPVVQYGPFVMNTHEEIVQAFEDYQFCKNGFEKARYWKRRA